MGYDWAGDRTGSAPRRPGRGVRQPADTPGSRFTSPAPRRPVPLGPCMSVAPAKSAHSPFLRAVAGQPDEDAPRLVYADWLDEHGDPDRAEFIRVQCALARSGLDHPH